MKKLLFPFALVAVAASSNAAVLLGSTTVGGTTYSIYGFDGGPTDWASANAFAIGLGGGTHLATITSAAEDATVSGLVIGSGVGEAWLGGFQTGAETSPSDGWNWVTAEGFSYSNWNGGEPNDAYGYQSEQYLAMWSNGLWNDEGNIGNTGGFVTEAVPEPASMAVLAFGAVALLRRRKKA